MDTEFRYFDVDAPGKDRATIQLWGKTDLIGAIFLRKQSLLPDRHPDPHSPCWQVAGIEVREHLRRQGFATLLYEEAARAAARHGMHLCSDVPLSLSNEALAFWEKQVKKGRAFWEVPGPPEREGENYDDGRFVLQIPVPPSLSGSGPKLSVNLLSDKTSKAQGLSVRADGGYLIGVLVDSNVIAKQFGKKLNPARWKLLKSLDAPIVWLDRIEVVKGDRDRGLGTKILKAALETAAQNGARYAILAPRPERFDDWERLLRFYGRFGFEEIREFGGDQLWEPLMILDLAA